MFAKASLSIAPQDAPVDPMPRNWRPAWIAIATPNIWAAWMIVGAITTGRMCRRMIRPEVRPETRAASTYSSSRTARTDERTRRYTPGAIRTPNTSMAALVLWPIVSITTSRTMIAGIAMTMLATHEVAPSKEPLKYPATRPVGMPISSGGRDRDQGPDEADLAAVEQPGPDVAADAVEAQRVSGLGGLERLEDRRGVRIRAREERCGEADDHDPDEGDDRRGARGIAEQAADDRRPARGRRGDRPGGGREGGDGCGAHHRVGHATRTFGLSQP